MFVDNFVLFCTLLKLWAYSLVCTTFVRKKFARVGANQVEVQAWLDRIMCESGKEMVSYEQCISMQILPGNFNMSKIKS